MPAVCCGRVVSATNQSLTLACGINVNHWKTSQQKNGHEILFPGWLKASLSLNNPGTQIDFCFSTDGSHYQYLQGNSGLNLQIYILGFANTRTAPAKKCGLCLLNYASILFPEHLSTGILPLSNAASSILVLVMLIRLMI